MPKRFTRRIVATSCLAALAAGCQPGADNPYAKIQDPPLAQATLHTATIVTTDSQVTQRLESAGFSRANFATNYPGAQRVEPMIWRVPADVAAAANIFVSNGQGPDVRVLVAAGLPPPAPVDAAVEKAFFRKVLGVDVPRLPEELELPADARVQVWTYFVDDLLAARARLRAAGVAVIFDPVAITSAYLGDHRTLAIQAPDNTVVQLVQNVAQ